MVKSERFAIRFCKSSSTKKFLFLDEGIDDNAFQLLDEESIRHLIPKMGPRLNFMKKFEEFCMTKENTMEDDFAAASVTDSRALEETDAPSTSVLVTCTSSNALSTSALVIRTPSTSLQPEVISPDIIQPYSKIEKKKSRFLTKTPEKDRLGEEKISQAKEEASETESV
ncbi:unnamed protein product [Psylliodes chrysocephalus]|uniref:Uncharacterized protein n=1 Tax=Psylliodes chrysocephalus TaxID=3402493 RepID=A0A9P0G816_9CUCU|nr:unnamed protein product [Psylliodes chrysocephala]